jgi:hypothetical protein
MSAIRTSLVKRRHAYTSVDIPWDMDESGESNLLRYLRGGGLRAFATTSAQMVRVRRQKRFLLVAAGLFALWTLFFFV